MKIKSVWSLTESLVWLTLKTGTFVNCSSSSIREWGESSENERSGAAHVISCLHELKFFEHPKSCEVSRAAQITRLQFTSELLDSKFSLARLSKAKTWYCRVRKTVKCWYLKIFLRIFLPVRFKPSFELFWHCRFMLGFGILSSAVSQRVVCHTLFKHYCSYTSVLLFW